MPILDLVDRLRSLSSMHDGSTLSSLWSLLRSSAQPHRCQEAMPVDLDKLVQRLEALNVPKAPQQGMKLTGRVWH